MESQEIRKKFLSFFEEHGHKIVPSSSLIPDDPSVLLTTAGMQQFKKYYTGEANPEKDFGTKNTVSIQKSFRTSDIDEVGDDSHLTFFEMLGNFSFGGYFKKDAISYAYDFFKEINLSIDFVTIFGGDEEISEDKESEEIWKSLGVKKIEKRGREDNFWGPTGNEGPCGPTTELYVNGVEIWNLVFNQYYCKSDKTITPLDNHGVDTGMGFERLVMVLQNKKNIFETDLFAPLFELLPQEIEKRHKRIIVDHLRASTFLLADGIHPSNKDRGYILRRLMRRAMVYENTHKIPAHVFDAIIHDIVHEYGEFYPELLKNNEMIREEFKKEREKFNQHYPAWKKYFDTAVENIESRRKSGMSEEFIENVHIPHVAFTMKSTLGIPFDIIKEWFAEKGYEFVEEKFDKEFKKHQEISRAGQEKKFGGHGLLLDTGELKAADEEELKIVTRLHTATHLLNAALHKVLGDSVVQNGSDITVERTRFDFNFPRKLTPEEIKKIEVLVNYAIEKNFPVNIETLPLEDAKKTGALFMERSKYPDPVKIYTVGDEKEIFSKELCGGPHVTHTREIGRFRIAKEESSSAGIRRIRGILE